MLPAMRLLTIIVAIVMGEGVLVSSSDVMPRREVFPGVGEYYYVGVPMNWTRALIACQADNAHMAVIDSNLEEAAIREMINNHEASYIHLGFHDQFIEGKYSTITGKRVDGSGTSDTEWAVGSPKGGTDYNCGAFSNAGITDIPCGQYLVYICEVHVPVAHPGYTHIPNFGHYKHHPAANATWQMAAETCEDDAGAHLVILNSQAEADALATTFDISSGQHFHVGVHRFFGGGNENFVTVLGGSLEATSYTTWCPGNPAGTFVTYPYVHYRVGDGATCTGLATLISDTTSQYICEILN